ncbi:hypothetical protein SGFS_065980 [Streptomyces graminofaciens]|uniref:Collagen-like protein n=1 Tax=Streptomyces graminofaciens TaxID=68212 RepID=A0ABN5VPL4_9ACTN|nr:hypothetical protein SGFS_065980 [Streptomyces graminofaciens]
MSRAQIRAEERRWRRGDVLTVVGAILLGVVLAWIVVAIQTMGRDLHEERGARDALARQVQDLGATPVAGPPGSRGEPGTSVTGPPGPRGEVGPSGPPGPSGSPGVDGEDGSDGNAGESGAPGVGVTGPAGPPGPQGEPGPAGPQGEPGSDGADGRDGQACPGGYSLQAPPYDEDALVCRKDSAPSEEESPSPQAAGLDPQRRVYA